MARLPPGEVIGRLTQRTVGRQAPERAIAITTVIGRKPRTQVRFREMTRRGGCGAGLAYGRA